MRIAATCAAVLAAAAIAAAAPAADVPSEPDIGGSWVANYELSDDPDKAVERAIKKAGGRPDSGGKRGRGRYRGGPANQELYDRITYDDVLTIRRAAPEFRFTYADNFTRVFYTDGRSRTVSATGTASGDNLDFSFGSWGGDTLNVEARVRDGGWTKERYTLQRSETGGQQLRVELQIAPLGFREPVVLIRIFDRKPGG
jgi:hypothetical protein